jgi:AcrR family transcriptional regulator
MPPRVDHDERRRAIAVALWKLARVRGLARISLRDVAAEAGMSLGQLQHYFPTRETLITHAMDLLTAETTARVKRRIAEIGPDPGPRDVVRVVVVEMLSAEDPEGGPLSSAQLSEALGSAEARKRVWDEMVQAHAAVEAILRSAVQTGELVVDTDVTIEAARLLALTGFSPLLELGVYTRAQVLMAIDRHLDQLFG